MLHMQIFWLIYEQGEVIRLGSRISMRMGPMERRQKVWRHMS